MNLRILKKLSKRAALLLPLLGDTREQFAAAHERTGDNFHECLITSRKHWKRSRVHARYVGRNDYRNPRAAQIVFTTRAGRRVLMQPPSHPRKGTAMVGSMDGGYEPEWSEECAWSALLSLVWASYVDWAAAAVSNDKPVCTRDLSTPSKIFRAARDLIRDRSARV